MEQYKTIEFSNNDEFIEKKSKFIGYAKPVKSEEEALDFIKTIKTKHWDATHNVYAYVLKDNNIQRYSDDGEPSGTAGVPVLDVILKNELVNVCVVVTRYFGGILLGTGGLVRAYSHGSKIAVESGNIITMSMCKIANVSVQYNFYDRMIILLNQYGATIENTEFLDKVNIEFSLVENKIEDLENSLIELSNGLYHLNIVGEKFAKI